MYLFESPRVNETALKILAKRYYWRDEHDNLLEKTPDDMFMRVATSVSKAELKFGRPEMVEPFKNRAFDMMRNLRWLANTPTLANAGRERGQLAACYVLPTSDSMEGIMDTLKYQALVQKSGGGTGFNFGPIRERNALIKSTGHKAAGPIPVIKLMNYMMSEFITQGGMRDGANMGTLPDDHPDLIEFITFKHKDGSCKSFNVSVCATDAFMEAVLSGNDWDLRSRVDGTIVKTVKAAEIFDMMVQYAWETGDPGMLFIDAANRANPTPHIGRLEATNPCGEQWLLPNEACTLGHHNLSAYYKLNPASDMSSLDWRNSFDWDLYAEDIEWAVRFLDNVIEINHYATPEIERMHKYTNRKIGLGVMGFADLLIKLGVPYASEEAKEIGNAIAKFHREKADSASYLLALERGSFGAFEGSEVQKAGWQAMRNACRTTVAPTGTTAIIAGASTSIEPVFGLFLKREQAGMVIYEVHPLFKDWLESLPESERDAVRDYYFEFNTLRGCKHVPYEVQEVYVQANDVHWKDHVLMQAVWQKHIDNAISKTINLPKSATIGDIRDAYILAWKMDCKGVTVYRDGCREHQALSTQKKEQPAITGKSLLEILAEPTKVEWAFNPQEMITNSQEQEGALCPECKSPVEMGGGCESCKACGWSVCHIS